MDGLTEAAGVGDLEDDFILSVLDGGALPNGAIDEAGESVDEEGTDMVCRLAHPHARAALTRCQQDDLDDWGGREVCPPWPLPDAGPV